MSDLFIAYDPSQSVGLRLSPEVRAEIVAVAPSSVANGSITAVKLAPAAVETAKIADDAVTSAKIADATIAAGNLAPNAVTTAKILDAAVTPAKVGDGVLTIKDSAGADLGATAVVLTDAEYAGLGTPDPNTIYLTTG